ncbi:MAG TPA: M20/M25/M40 family metallo-hydrolase, partial [Phycisphaerales bacterium]|nr:M20/M25/M40 family metallo-hydrolase [Phycisphaerales bacterium]
GIVIAISALEALKACGVDVTWTMALNSDEETGSHHSAKALRAEARKHDVGVVLEPATADGGLVTERMGSGTFQVEVFGKSAHVGRDFKSGVSAVLKLAEVMSAIGKLSDAEQGRIVNIGPVVGGGATNVVADHAACWGNMRFANAKQAEELVRAIEAMATKDDVLPRVVVRVSANRPAKPETEEVRGLAKVAREVSEELGMKLPFAKTGGVCDGNLLQEEGLPTVDTLGVRGGNLHREDEFVELDTIVARCQLLAVFLMRITA